MKLRNLASAAVAAMLIAPAMSGAATIQSTTIGNWLLGAYSNDGTGQFSHCAMSASYRSGIYMLFSLNRNFQWSLGFADPAWRLNKGVALQVGMTIDGRTPILEQATAIDAHQVEIPLPANTYLFDRFRHGLQLRVNAVGQDYFFNLNGTSRGLAELALCTDHFTGRR